MKILVFGAYTLLVLAYVGNSAHGAQQATRLDVVMIKLAPIAPAYTCSGVINGKAYALALETKAFGDGFQLTWFGDGQKAFSGFGLRHGDYLAVFAQDVKGNVLLSNYRIEAGTLNGRWMIGDGKAEAELCLVGKPA